MAEDRGGRGNVVKRMRSDNYFDEDIVTEILARLPVKSIVRFRCVCKSWRAIIASSHFVKKQLSYVENGTTNSNFRLLFLQNPPQSIDYEALKKVWNASRDIQFPVNIPSFYCPHAPIIRVSGACNGLVCFEFQNVGIFLCNPCTGASEVLPNPPTECDSLDFYGFGYDSRTDDYKVIRGRSTWESVDVFALKSGSWRTIPGLDCAGAEGMGCLFNGALHWIVHESRIVSFSVAEEKFEVVPLLHDDFDGVLVYKDRLCVYEILDGAPGFVSVWSMEEYGVKESWTEVIHYTLQKSGREEYTPLCILQSGDILLHRILYDHDYFYDDQDNPADADEFDNPAEPDPAPDEQDNNDDADEFDYPAAPEEIDKPVDPDVFDYPKPDYPDPDSFDDPHVFGEPFDDIDPYDDDIDPYRDCYQQLMPDDPDEIEDQYEELDVRYNQQMWEKKSLFVLVDQTTANWVLEVDLPGFGAAIYRETLVSPLTAAGGI